MKKRIWGSRTASIRRGMIYSCSYEGNSNDNIDGRDGTDTDITYSLANGFILQGAGFNGTTSNITIPGLTSSVNYTISVWVKPASNANDYNALITNADGSFGLYWRPLLNRFSFHGIISGNPVDLVNNTFVSDGQWTQITMTNGIDGSQLYVNGALDSVQFFQFAFFMITQFGSNEIGDAYTGDMDISSIWNRELTAAEVLQYYQVSLTKQYPFN